jgi:hypothetical protein
VRDPVATCNASTLRLARTAMSLLVAALVPWHSGRRETTPGAVYSSDSESAILDRKWKPNSRLPHRIGLREPWGDCARLDSSSPASALGSYLTGRRAIQTPWPPQPLGPRLRSTWVFPQSALTPQLSRVEGKPGCARQLSADCGKTLSG